MREKIGSVFIDRKMGIINDRLEKDLKYMVQFYGVNMSPIKVGEEVFH